MRLRPLVLLPLAAALLAAGLATPATAAPEARAYIVVLKDDVAHPSDVAAEHRRDHGARVTRTYGAALKGYAATLTGAAYGEVVRDRRVAYVEVDGVATASQLVQPAAPWGLDRIDQRALPLDTTYTAPATGGAVTAYVVDSGVRSSHSDLAARVATGHSTVNDGRGTEDCNGHGTHVAGTVGGSSYGVAKQVTIVPVRVLGCNGSGSWSGVIAGVDWVAAHHLPGQPAVANMSLGGPASRAVDTAVRAAIADGVTFAVAAGNEGGNACSYSPARVTEALTVGATTDLDARATFSNSGSCVDLFAPGEAVLSAGHTADDAVAILSGTSMASPHVAGVVALHLAAHPGSTPAAVAAAVVAASTAGVVTSAGTGPNRLLFNVVPAVAAAPTTSGKRK